MQGERISGLKEKLEELDHSTKENVKSNKTKQKPKKQTHHQQKRMEHTGTRNTIKRPNQ